MSEAKQTDKYKLAAAEAAAVQLKDGMILGLGSGTTAEIAVGVIGKRVREGLQVSAVSTSEKTSDLARRWGIPVFTLEEKPSVDLTIDGADEIQLGTLDLIKGGGGNLLREKIVALASSRLHIIADESKLVSQLGLAGRVPVEVVPFGWKTTHERLAAIGGEAQLRKDAAGAAYVTDGGHYILDCAFGAISSAAELAAKVDGIAGVVEHGLFVGMAQRAYIGGAEGVTVIGKTS